MRYEVGLALSMSPRARQPPNLPDCYATTILQHKRITAVCQLLSVTRSRNNSCKESWMWSLPQQLLAWALTRPKFASCSTMITPPVWKPTRKKRDAPDAMGGKPMPFCSIMLKHSVHSASLRDREFLIHAFFAHTRKRFSP